MMDLVLVKHRTPTGVETVLQFQPQDLPEGAEVIDPARPVDSKVREPKPGGKKVDTK